MDVRGHFGRARKNERMLLHNFKGLAHSAQAIGSQDYVDHPPPDWPGFEDVYVLGIRETAEKLGIIVERADDVQHNGNVLALIQKKVREADVIIGDTTGGNPNVFYEIGYAHACDRPTILISKKGGKKLPFDLQSENHIFFEMIVELRGPLEERLKYSLGL